MQLLMLVRALGRGHTVVVRKQIQGRVPAKSMAICSEFPNQNHMTYVKMVMCSEFLTLTSTITMCKGDVQGTAAINTRHGRAIRILLFNSLYILMDKMWTVNTLLQIS
jgi:hypothetical protein